MAANNFDLKGFLNDPKSQADKAGAVKFLQQKGIIDSLGKVVGDVGAPKSFLGKTLDTIKGIGNFFVDQLPAVGGTVGGILGGVAGTPADVVSGPLGTVAGATAGAALGGSAGEALKEKIQGSPLSAGNIAVQGGVMGATEAIGGPVLKLAGRGVEAAGEGLAKAFIPKSIQEASMLQTYKAGTSLIDRIGAVLGFGEKKAPGTAASTAFSQALMGTESMIGVQAKRAQSAIWDNIVAPALKQSDTKVNLWDFFKEAEDKIVKENIDPTRQKSLLEALTSIQKDFKGTIQKGVNIGLDELQKFKEGWAKFVPESSYKGKVITGPVNEVRDILSGLSRNKIYTSLGENVKQAYLDYGNLHGITALGQKAMTGVTNIIQGGTGTSIKNVLERVLLPIGTIGGQIIYKAGQGVELLGKPGARIVRDIISGSASAPTKPSAPSTTGAPSQPLPPITTTPPMSQ